MKHEGPHPPDRRLLLDLEGELSPNGTKQIRAHIESCWMCRARRQELEEAIVDSIRAHQQEMDPKIPPVDGARALLTVRLAEVSAAALFLARSDARHYGRSHPKAVIVSIPDPRLTPGATILSTRLVVCAQANTKNKAVPAELQRKVFEEYGIAGTEPRAYEVDYLVTPAIGGADDIRNLWPHSYSATVWNARVKDALEDRLREMVCEGSLDLMEAQKEIAANWIAAYKKYFHTETPLEQHYKPETPN